MDLWVKILRSPSNESVRRGGGLTVRNPASLKTFAFLRKEDRLDADIILDDVGIDVPDLEEVGYGLDRAVDWRALPYFGEMPPDRY